MKSIFLKDKLKNEKLKFYQEQLFDSMRPLKRTLGILITFIIVCDFVLTQFILPKDIVESPDSQGSVKAVILFGFILTLVCYYISIFKFFEKQSSKIFRIRYILILLSAIFFSVSQGIDGYSRLIGLIGSNSAEKWFYALIKGRNETWMILLVDTLVPVWYMKLIIPSSIWITQVIAYHHGGLGNPEVIWSAFIMSTIYTASVWGIKAHSNWKAYLTRSNTEAWDDVHQYILDRVPDAIAIIDEKSTIIYSNQSFKTLSNDKLTNISLKEIKKLESNFQKKTSSDNQTEFNAKNEEEQSLHFANTNYNEGRTEVESSSSSSLSKLISNIFTQILKGTIKSDEYFIYNAKLIPNATPDSKGRSYEVKIGPLLEYKKVIIILSDTTQRDLAVSLETANHYKDKLLATVSHDLRAPLTGGLAFIESTIEHKDVPSAVKEQYLIPAQKSCKFLLHLVNDILDFSLINAQKLRMNYEDFSLIETIKSCHQLMQIQANLKKIEFPLVLDEKLPAKFMTDHNRLSQIIINLLTNAIKFTLKGEVRLSAEIVEDNLIEIKVSDTGIGIKDEDLPKLFHEFASIQYDQRDINNRGVGLGLVIANKLAKTLGPKDKKRGIFVSSTYGQGTVFSFLVERKRGRMSKGEIEQNFELSIGNRSIGSLINVSEKEENFFYQKIEEIDSINSKFSQRLPYDFSMKRQELGLFSPIISGPATPVNRNSSKVRQDKVLIVDDNPLNILALESILKHYGIHSDSAFSGQEAIEKILQEEGINKEADVTSFDSFKGPKFDKSLAEEYKLIFMDYEMPGLSGIETAKRLIEMMRSNKIKWTPIIGCTGHCEEEILKECCINGMSAVITKPPQREQLAKLIEKYLGHT